MTMRMPMLDRLRHLPRDTRDTLFLLLVIAWVLAPQFGRLPLWCTALTVAVLAWRATLAWNERPLPSRWWLLGLLVLTISATLLTHRTLLGRDAGVTLLVVLLTLKTLELRARRDAFVVFFLSFFTMLTNFFFSQSLLTAAAMLVALMGLLTALVNTHMPVGKPPLREAAGIALTMAALGAPIMLVLFMLFPRLAPLWGVPTDAMAGRSGLSSTMEVGAIAELALDDSIAMRIRFAGLPPPQSELYFRGPVLSTLQGRQWQALQSAYPSRLQDAAGLQVEGEPIRYQVTLEPNNRPWIFVLDAAPNAPDARSMPMHMSAQLQWIADRPVADLLRYSAQSYTEFRHGPLRRTVALQDYLALPPGLNPRTMAWASELQRDPALGADPARMMDAVLQHLRTGDYSYTLEPGVYGQNTADEFWFDRRTGFCEHIASAFAIMMRSLDIPSRIVTGYQGGEVNAVDGFWTLRPCLGRSLVVRPWLDPCRSDVSGRAGPHRKFAAPAPAARRVGVGHAGRQPADMGPAARHLGGAQQRLEPVDPELQPEQATRPAQGHRLRRTELGGSWLRAAGPDGPFQPAGRPVDLVGTQPAGSLAASARARRPQFARRRMGRRASQSTAHHGTAGSHAVGR
jgi:transglutaminase-like putative cysteine protease